MRLSFVIPTLNEAPRIAETIRSARAAGADEIVVVDGGSDDGTLQHAVRAGADCCLESSRGRAVQQNRGAAAAQGDVLLFLHADCRLSAGANVDVRMALADDRCVGGCFRQQIEAPGWGYRMLEAGNAARVRFLGWAYGDQGIFVRRDVFERLGGFPDLPLMEDLYLMKRLKRVGRITLVESRIHVDPRRWKRTGLCRQTVRNWTLVGLAHCGVSPTRLARFYPEVR
jgi:rSAM/selenodomain-associated transferase 2